MVFFGLFVILSRKWTFNKFRTIHMETSFIRLPFGFNGKFSIFRANIYLQNDKGIQTTHRSLCNNNEKDSFSWNQYDLLPPSN